MIEVWWQGICGQHLAHKQKNKRHTDLPLYKQWRNNGRDDVSNHQPHLSLVYSIVYSGADQRKRKSSASLAFVWGIHQWPVNYQHKKPVTRKMFPFDDVIMQYGYHSLTPSWEIHEFSPVDIFVYIYIYLVWKIPTSSFNCFGIFIIYILLPPRSEYR